MAAAGWPLPAPLSLVTQAAIASPLGVIAIDGHSAAVAGSEMAWSAPNAPPACGRVEAWTVQWT